MTNQEDNGGSGSGDRLLGECSINLVEVVSGRVPHMEEWVPLNTEGDLRLSLDYDSVGCPPVPGDSVRSECNSNISGGTCLYLIIFRCFFVFVLWRYVLMTNLSRVVCTARATALFWVLSHCGC